MIEKEYRWFPTIAYDPLAVVFASDTVMKLRVRTRILVYEYSERVGKWGDWQDVPCVIEGEDDGGDT